MTQKNELEEKLTNFFNAENDRDWKLYESFLSEDVQWISYGPPKRKVVSGKKDYIKTMIRAYRNIPERFSVLNMVSDIESGVVIAELELRARRSVAEVPERSQKIADAFGLKLYPKIVRR